MFEGRETYKKPENAGSRLACFMEEISRKLNDEISKYGQEEFLDKNNSINMEAFEDFDVEADKAKILEKDIEWSAAENSNTQEFYKSRFGVEGIGSIVEQFRKNKEKSASAQSEKAITGLLHKILGEGFMVMRSAVYDDYFNGIDNVIVDRETGDVVCAFDEVHDEADGERQAKKIEKIKKISRRGGATLKYGVTFEKDDVTGEKKLAKKTIWHIPVFYLGLSSKELSGLLSNMNYEINGEAGQAELGMFDKLTESLEEQVGILEKEKITPEVRKKLDKFKILLLKMKDLRLEKAK